jgi:hypothetical protein
MTDLTTTIKQLDSLVRQERPLTELVGQLQHTNTPPSEAVLTHARTTYWQWYTTALPLVPEDRRPNFQSAYDGTPRLSNIIPNTYV